MAEGFYDIDVMFGLLCLITSTIGGFVAAKFGCYVIHHWLNIII